MATSWLRSSPESFSLEGGVYPGHNVFKNSTKNGFSMACQGTPHITKAFTHDRSISWILSGESFELS